MPLGPEYDKLIDSQFADMKNTGGRNGGSITAAQFLQRFVNDTPWAHLDIAGTGDGRAARPTSITAGARATACGCSTGWSRTITKPRNSGSRMTEVLFYHLQNMPLESVLPPLLEKSLERGWRVVVQTRRRSAPTRSMRILWTYSDDTFLPHATWRDGDAPDQPIMLAVEEGNPNRRQGPLPDRQCRAAGGRRRL